jgi:quinol-cytochrome oxidoreductase complex cytochrome b subunit
VNTSKVPWLATVVICAIAAIILALEGYTGYSITVGAVGLAAAVNLR